MSIASIGAWWIEFIWRRKMQIRRDSTVSKISPLFATHITPFSQIKTLSEFQDLNTRLTFKISQKRESPCEFSKIFSNARVNPKVDCINTLNFALPIWIFFVSFRKASFTIFLVRLNATTSSFAIWPLESIITAYLQICIFVHNMCVGAVIQIRAFFFKTQQLNTDGWCVRSI